MGVEQVKIQSLVCYWEKDCDWRKIEGRLNELPQFVTEIDGLDIHFIHVRSRQPSALPIIITHGWPGSILELVKVIGPLMDPTAYGGGAQDAFDVVLPSMPGYGFRTFQRTSVGIPIALHAPGAVLMDRLGYKHYVSQGGDWDSVVSNVMARQAAEGLLGIHVNMPATVPPDIAKALNDGDPAPAGLSEQGAAQIAAPIDLKQAALA